MSATGLSPFAVWLDHFALFPLAEPRDASYQAGLAHGQPLPIGPKAGSGPTP